MRKLRAPYLLLALPALLIYAFLMVGPLLQLLYQSFFIEDAELGVSFTLEFYRSLASPSFLRVLGGTIRTSLLAAGLSTVIGYLIAYHLVRRCSSRRRNLWLNIIVSVLFLSLLIRIYAISLTFGSTGLMPYIARLGGLSPTSPILAEVLIIVGLLNFTLPLAVLSLLAVVENINPRLSQAAQSLGASRYLAFLTVDAALCLPNLLSTAVLTFSLCISAFLVPMILGRGFVEFISNLVYVRFSELFDPSTGAAMAMVLLVVTLAIISGLQFVFRDRKKGF